MTQFLRDKANTKSDLTKFSFGKSTKWHVSMFIIADELQFIVCQKDENKKKVIAELLLFERSVFNIAEN